MFLQSHSVMLGLHQERTVCLEAFWSTLFCQGQQEQVGLCSFHGYWFIREIIVMARDRWEIARHILKSSSSGASNSNEAKICLWSGSSSQPHCPKEGQMLLPPLPLVLAVTPCCVEASPLQTATHKDGTAWEDWSSSTFIFTIQSQWKKKVFSPGFIY